MRVMVTGGSGFIGTHLVDALLERGIPFLNLDIHEPKKGKHLPCWRGCDILDFELTLRHFNEFQPTHLVHLAARTDTLSSDLVDYKVNTEGTLNILNCTKSLTCMERIVITSSQFAFAPPGLPRSDEDYAPIGAYGLSKVLTEKVTRSAGLTCVWTITRPTNIWGPWHPRYPSEFWRVLKRGFYVHPGGKSAIRSYGYVKNIVFQTMRILEAQAELVNGKVYYLGDPPIPLIEWVNGFALAITGTPARTIPKWFVKVLATIGTVLSGAGIRFPITLSRYRSMTEDYFSPVEKTIRLFGVPPYSMEDGIKETVHWLNRYWNGEFSST